MPTGVKKSDPRFVIARSEATKQSSFVVQSASLEAGLLRSARNDAGRAVSQITCPALSAKISCFLSEAKHLLNRAVSSHQGRSRSSRTRGEMRWTLLSTADERG